MRVRCPECDARVKVPEDHDRPFVRCTSCKEKIPIDVDDEPRKASTKRAGKSAAKASGTARSGKFLAQYGFPFGSIAVVGLIGLVLLAGALFHEVPAMIAFTIGPLVALFAFVMACVLARRDGHYIGFLDFLGISEGLAILLLILFAGCYISIFGLLWCIAILKSTIQKPKLYLPWLALYGMGLCIMIGIPIIHSFAKQAGLVIDTRRPVAVGPDVHAPRDKGASQDKQDVERDRKDALNKDQRKDDAKKDKEEPPKKLPPPKVTGDEAIDRALQDLSAADRKNFVPAAQALSKMAPNQHRAVVAQKLAEQLPKSEPGNRTPLLRALGVWGTANEVPALLLMLNEKDGNTKNETMQALGKLRDGRAAAPLVQCLHELSTQYHAEQALRSIGPPAEKEVLTLLNQNEIKLKVIAVRLLKDMGTQQSVPALQAASRGPIEIQDGARQALMAIAARTKK
jgi:HEAT repeat protein